MAQQLYWLGSQGPFYFDDSLTVGESVLPERALTTESQIYLGTAPSANENAVRKGDLTGAGIGTVVIPNGSALVLKGPSGKPDLYLRWDGDVLRALVSDLTPILRAYR